MKKTQVTNNAGRVFNIRIIQAGDSYGLNGCLKFSQAESDKFGGPMVEFWDATHAGKNGFGPEGQFVARYYASTLAKDHQQWTAVGLMLDGGNKEWSVTGANVVAALMAVLA